MAEDTAKALTVAQVAERLQVDRRTVYGLIESGQLHAKKVGRVWRVPMAALLAYLESNGGAHAQEGQKGGLAPAW